MCWIHAKFVPNAIHNKLNVEIGTQTQNVRMNFSCWVRLDSFQRLWFSFSYLRVYKCCISLDTKRSFIEVIASIIKIRILGECSRRIIRQVVRLGPSLPNSAVVISSTHSVLHLFAIIYELADAWSSAEKNPQGFFNELSGMFMITLLSVQDWIGSVCKNFTSRSKWNMKINDKVKLNLNSFFIKTK